MKIDWQITKKRGNFRPILKYAMVLESFERKLAVQAVWVKSLIPQIPNAGHSYCLPGENERHPLWMPSEFHRLQVPFFKTGERRDFLRLPFRESGQYPEVEASFVSLRSAYETVVQKVYGQDSIDQEGRLDMSSETKACVAAKVTADRLLNLFGPPAGVAAGTSPFMERKAG